MCVNVLILLPKHVYGCLRLERLKDSIFFAGIVLLKIFYRGLDSLNNAEGMLNGYLF